MFTIDFFELSFLAEACIPPRPIARTMFWQNLTNKYWDQMTQDERNRLWEWMNRNEFYKRSLTQHVDTQIFEARFNPSLNFIVTASYLGSEEQFQTFYRQGKFWTGTNTYLGPELITGVSSLSNLEVDLDLCEAIERAAMPFIYATESREFNLA